MENGLSPLDGILPSDLGGDCFDDLFEKSENTVVNGVVNHDKMNGDVSSAGKRLLGEYPDTSPAKRQALESGVVVTNGGHGNGSLNGSGQQAGQVILKTGGGVVLQSAGAAGNGQSQVIVQGGDQGGNKVVFLQQNSGTVVRPGQQTVVHRVSAPVAQVAPAQPGDHLPQVDGADDETLSGDTDNGDSSNVPQVDGTTTEPSSSTQDHPQPDQDATAAPAADQSAAPQQSVIQKPATPTPSDSEPATATSPSSPAAAAATSPASSSAGSSTAAPSSSIDTKKPFLCEWAGCLQAFKTPKEVENHAISSHCPLGSDDIPCMWARCDGMKRKRFSLMTHLQDRHCHPQVVIRSLSMVAVPYLEYIETLIFQQSSFNWPFT